MEPTGSSAGIGEGPPSPPKPELGLLQERRRTTPIGASAEIGEGPPHQGSPKGPPPGLARNHPPHQSQQQARARNGGELQPQGPPPGLAPDDPTNQASNKTKPRVAENCTLRAPAGLARDQPTKGSSTPQPACAGNSTHRAIYLDWQGTTPPRPAKGASRERRGTAPIGSSPRIGKGAPTLPMAAQGPSQEGWGTAPRRPSARIGEGPPHQSQQQAPTRNGGERIPQHTHHRSHWRGQDATPYTNTHATVPSFERSD